MIPDKTAEIQAKINSFGSSGAQDIFLDLNDFGTTIGVTSVVPPPCRSFIVEGADVNVFQLGLTAPGNPNVSKSVGVFHFQMQSGTTAPGHTIEYVHFGSGITFDGQAPFVGNPDKSDLLRNPQGLKRSMIHQISYGSGKIVRFECLSQFRNIAAGGINLANVEKARICSRFVDSSRACMMFFYHPGSTPYDVDASGCRFETVSSMFDCSRPPGVNTIRDSVPIFTMKDFDAMNVWNRTKIHGHWDALLEHGRICGNGFTGYAAVNIPNETVGEVVMRDLDISGYWSSGVTWNIQSGSIFVERIKTRGCRCPILKQGNIEPVVTGPNEYHDAHTPFLFYPRVGDRMFNDNAMDWQKISQEAIDQYKWFDIPPIYGWQNQLNPQQAQYAQSIGWNPTTGKWN